MSLFWQTSKFVIYFLFSVCVYGDASSTCLNKGLKGNLRGVGSDCISS